MAGHRFRLTAVRRLTGYAPLNGSILRVSSRRQMHAAVGAMVTSAGVNRESSPLCPPSSGCAKSRPLEQLLSAIPIARGRSYRRWSR